MNLSVVLKFTALVFVLTLSSGCLSSTKSDDDTERGGNDTEIQGSTDNKDTNDFDLFGDDDDDSTSNEIPPLTSSCLDEVPISYNLSTRLGQLAFIQKLYDYYNGKPGLPEMTYTDLLCIWEFDPDAKTTVATYIDEATVAELEPILIDLSERERAGELEPGEEFPNFPGLTLGAQAQIKSQKDSLRLEGKLK